MTDKPGDTEILTARDGLVERLPKWLRDGPSGHVAYAIGAHADAIVEMLIAGVQSRWPGFDGGYSSLGLIGRDRRIRRGLQETDAGYAARLLTWLDEHPFRGGPYAMLRQLHAFFAPNNFRIELINPSGLRYSMNPANGLITRDTVTWTPPGDHPAMFARWWLFFFVADPPDNDGYWGDPGAWGDGGLWGVDMTAEALDAYQIVASEWRAKHAEGLIVILDESEDFDSYAPGEWPVQIAVKT